MITRFRPRDPGSFLRHKGNRRTRHAFADDLLTLVAAVGFQPGLDGTNAARIAPRGQAVALALERREVGFHLLDRACELLARSVGITITAARLLNGNCLFDFLGLPTGGVGVALDLRHRTAGSVAGSLQLAA